MMKEAKKILTRIDYGVKPFSKGEPLNLELLEIRNIPRWLQYLIIACFVAGIIVVPLPYKFLILGLLLFNLNLGK